MHIETVKQLLTSLTKDEISSHDAYVKHMDKLVYYFNNHSSELTINSRFMLNCVRYEFLVLLRLVHEKGYLINFTDAYEIAAQHGKLNSIVWLHSIEAAKGKISWTDSASRNAAEYGHLDVLKWIVSHGCPWNKFTIIGAVIGGHLDVLTWMLDNNCPIDLKICIKHAANNGHLDIIKFLNSKNSNNPLFNKYSIACAYAALGGHLDILKWLHENGWPMASDTCSHAAMYGHFEIIKWAHANGCPLDTWTRHYAKEYGHTEIVKWFDTGSKAPR